MKSKRMISLLMAALGSVSTSMAAKRVNKGGNVSSSNALRVRRPGGTSARGRRRNGRISGQGARRPGGRIARKISETEKQKLNQSGAVLTKENAVEKKNAVNNGAHGGSQSTWEKMSNLEKGLTIGGSSLVGTGIVAGGIAGIVKRNEINDWWIKRGNLSASEHNKKLCEKGAKLSNNVTEVQLSDSTTVNVQPVPSGQNAQKDKEKLVKRWKTFEYNNGEERGEFVVVRQHTSYGDKWYAVPVNYYHKSTNKQKKGKKITVEDVLQKSTKDIVFNGGSLPEQYRETLVKKLKSEQNAENSTKRVCRQLGLEQMPGQQPQEGSTTVNLS